MSQVIHRCIKKQAGPASADCDPNLLPRNLFVSPGPLPRLTAREDQTSHNGHSLPILPIWYFPSGLLITFRLLQRLLVRRKHHPFLIASPSWNPLPISGRIMEIPSIPDNGEVYISRHYHCFRDHWIISDHAQQSHLRPSSGRID